MLNIFKKATLPKIPGLPRRDNITDFTDTTLYLGEGTEIVTMMAYQENREVTLERIGVKIKGLFIIELMIKYTVEPFYLYFKNEENMRMAITVLRPFIKSQNK